MIEIVWDDETKQYVRAEDLRERKLKREIISELIQALQNNLIQALQNNYTLQIQINLQNGTGTITIVPKQK